MTPSPNLYVYDTETYPNVFTIGIVHLATNTRWLFEISDRVDQSKPLVSFLFRMRDSGCRMIGFNNEGFDYPVIHALMNGTHTVRGLYDVAMRIINAPWNDRSNTIWERDRYIEQIDLYRIMHFDNVNRRTSLKKLELAMRSRSVEDLPFPPGTLLDPDQIDTLVSYMCWDISETAKFAMKILDRIMFRDTLTAKYHQTFTNYNDTKIGKQHFINELENAGVQCFERVGGKRVPRQTPRLDGIHVGEKLINVPFETDALKQMHRFFAGSVIPPDETKGFFTNVHAELNDFTMHFGAGGIHGSVNNQTFHSDDKHVVWDWDVTSYYPSIAIVNRWYPEHLGETFCDIYEDLKRQRVGFAKGSPENAMLKLALNGVYGDSNNKYSPFYDPAYTMTVTINGQMLLAWLAEMLVTRVPGLQMIQNNTDGLTFKVSRSQQQQVRDICDYWTKCTLLDLEDVEYRSMFVRDVNNYIAIDTNGKTKRKNAYMTTPDWHQDHSSLVIPKAVDAFVQDGIKPVDFIFSHTDAFDFMQHIKVPRSSRLEHGDKIIQNTSRYQIALTGAPLTKIMPPLKGGDNERRIGVNVGWKVQVCNDIDDFQWDNLNRRYYVQEAEKLVRGLGVDV